MVEPALSAEEWALFFDPAAKEWAPLMFSNHSRHSSAAVNLLGQPFGFTRDLLVSVQSAAASLRHWRGVVDNMVDPDDYDKWMAELDGVADRIEALLPPEET